MSPLRRCFSTDLWATLHNQFPSAPDVKIKSLAPTYTLQEAKDRELYLTAQIKEMKAIPSLYDATVKEVAARLIEVQQFIAAHKQ